jgi:hypothetical protein
MLMNRYLEEVDLLYRQCYARALAKLLMSDTDTAKKESGRCPEDAAEVQIRCRAGKSSAGDLTILHKCTDFESQFL